MTDLLAEALDLFEYTRALRRDFHRNPELGFQEVRTAGIVAKELNKLGLEVTTGIGKTGVVGLVEGSKPGPTILMRFDMDALPIVEETGAEYASVNQGVMHACGHDGHTAIGLAVATLLQRHREELAGNVKMVFQPAEEGLGGAEAMIADGVLENPRPQKAFAMHLWNDKPVGWMGMTPGPAMAASELFWINIIGKGGHGAAPHIAIDPVLAAAQVVTALQSIVSRNVNPLETAVVSVTAIRGGEATNVIPPNVELKGTIRTFNPSVRTMVLERFRTIVEQVTNAMGCKAEITLKPFTPAVLNDAEITAQVTQLGRRLMPDVDIETDHRTMGSEDMAFFLRQIPGTFVFVGSANAERGLNAPHHHPKFDVDEEALPKAVALMASIAMDELK